MPDATRCVDKYVLREQLSREAGTEVWKAFDSGLQRDVVIKLLLRTRRTSPEFVQRFQQVWRTTASLNHPNIVQIYDITGPDVVAEDGEEFAAYVVLPDVYRTTLADSLVRTVRAGTMLEPTELVQLFTAVGSAIDQAHQQGVIHGNISPATILLHGYEHTHTMGQPILTDFGHEQLHSPEARTPDATSIVSGSPLYAAPEQASSSVSTKQSDLYALGTILYELCTGRYPFADMEQRPLTLLFQKINALPTPPSRLRPVITPELEAVILRSIAREPEKRFPDARSMTRALAQAFSISVSRMLVLEYYALCPAPAAALVKREQSGPASEQRSLAAERERFDEEPFQRGAKDQRRAQELTSASSATRSVQSANAGLNTLTVAKSHRPRLNISWVILVVLLISLLAAGLLAVSLKTALDAQRSLTQKPDLASTVFGQVLFLSSEQGDLQQNRGLNDEVQVDLTHLGGPAAGKAYFAWLQGDVKHNDTASVFLGQLNVSRGAAHLLYIDPQHRDLLISASRFLITEESAGSHPLMPSADTHTWRYAGEIPQLPNPNDQSHFSLLDHLRHLLASDPELDVLGLHGGLSTWFYHNGSLIQQYAHEAQTSFEISSASSLNRQLVLLLEYLDGIKDVSRDVPAGTPLTADPLEVRLGMLQTHANQDPPSYVYHIGVHLSGLLNSPGATSSQRQLAVTIVQTLNIVNASLQKVRTIGLQLVNLDPGQLLQTSVKTQLAALVQQADAAYYGPKPGQRGIVWLHEQLAKLASISVTAYQAT